MRLLAATTSAALVLSGLTTVLAPGVATAATPAIAWDFDGDDFADAAIGAPGEDSGNASNAGVVTLLRGTEDGLTTTSATALTQRSEGVPGRAEDGDRFGSSLASGDIDRDGFADLVIGTPGESFGADERAGAITVVYGSADGLASTTAEGRSEPVHRQGNRFGAAVTMGSFDGDGFADVAVGSPGGNRVWIFSGSPDGLETDGFVWSPNSPGVPGTRHPGESFGYALAAGDLDDDGRDDLAVGSPFDVSGGQQDPNGSVTVIYGSPATPSGLTPIGAQLWHRGKPGVRGKPHRDAGRPDSFGAAVAVGDNNGDGFADLTVGAPGTPVTAAGEKRQDAGALNNLRGTSNGLTAEDDRFVTQATNGIPGKARARALFGAGLAAGNVQGDDWDEIAAGAPGRNNVVVLTGFDGPFGGLTDQRWTQDTVGVGDEKEDGDAFGADLRFAAIMGFGNELLIGAPGEDNGSGVVTLLGATQTGLSPANSRNFSQDSNNVPGSKEAGDRFGSL